MIWSVLIPVWLFVGLAGVVAWVVCDCLKDGRR